MEKPKDIPQDVWLKADVLASEYRGVRQVEMIARAILSAVEEERARWEPAARYFDRYCQDEADDVENCVCGLQQHEDAKAFATAIRNRKGA